MDSPRSVKYLPPGPLARWRRQRWLRLATHVGHGVRLEGRPYVANTGQITIGDDFFLSSQPVQSHIVATSGALIDIGDHVRISYGAAISAQRLIRIGRGTSIGPFVVIMDSDFHRPGNRELAGEIAPVHIGADVAIGDRVTILRGADIGDGARVRSGSMVSGTVAKGQTVGGVPARVLSDSPRESELDIPQLVQIVLGLASRPDPAAGPGEIPEWDSLGTLRLLLAIEETYGISVREKDVQSARTVAALAAVVDDALAG